MDKITRVQAIEQGLKRYFTGKPCKNGHVAERLVSSRGCVECKQAGEIGRYARDPEKGLARKKAWRLTNPESEARAKLKYARTHREKVRADYKVWAARNKDRIKEYAAQFKASHPDYDVGRLKEWRENNPEKSRETARLWRQENSGKVRAYTSNYRARKIAAPGSWTEADIKRLFADQSGVCCGCSRKFSANLKFHIDHILPLSRGGSNYPHNLQLLCVSCNTSKGAKTMDEWRV